MALFRAKTRVVTCRCFIYIIYIYIFFLISGFRNIKKSENGSNKEQYKMYLTLSCNVKIVLKVIVMHNLNEA